MLKTCAYWKWRFEEKTGIIFGAFRAPRATRSAFIFRLGGGGEDYCWFEAGVMGFTVYATRVHFAPSTTTSLPFSGRNVRAIYEGLVR